MCEKFANLIKKKLEMSLTGDLTFFIGLQIKQNFEVTFISRDSTGKNLSKSTIWKIERPMEHQIAHAQTLI